MHLAPGIMDSQGKIDFTKLRSLAFSDHQIKESLEQFLYSQLPDVFWKFYKLLPAKPYFFYEVPLLFEKNLQCLVDLVVVLYTDPKVQLQRLSLRDNSSPEINEKIIQSQMPFENKKKLSHYIVDNNGSNEQLYSQVDILLENIQHVFQP